MSRSTFEQNIAKLEQIASEECQCTQDDGGDGSGDGGICRACKAGGTLNRISADAFDDLKRLEKI